jgi:hypothetical protein
MRWLFFLTRNESCGYALFVAVIAGQSFLNKAGRARIASQFEIYNKKMAVGQIHFRHFLLATQFCRTDRYKQRYPFRTYNLSIVADHSTVHHAYCKQCSSSHARQ